MKVRLIIITLGLALVVGLGIWAATAPGSESEIGSYVTSLRGRTDSQRHNCALALSRINNTVVPPGATFSFCSKVGSWTADQGYEKAPVSYDGEFVRSWGGGVCQASSTLYNAALLAGLDIVERHRHHWPAKYAPPGRDAAVAYSSIDLKFRNNLPKPVRIVGRIQGDSMSFKILSHYKPRYKVRVRSEMLSVIKPYEVVQDRNGSGKGRWQLVNRGRPGYHVLTYRIFDYGSKTRREFLSEDRYPAMNRVVRLADR